MARVSDKDLPRLISNTEEFVSVALRSASGSHILTNVIFATVADMSQNPRINLNTAGTSSKLLLKLKYQSADSTLFDAYHERRLPFHA